MDKFELNTLLNLVLGKIANLGTIDTELYSLLVTIFPTIIAPALDIIDNGRITKLICQKSGRSFHKVKENASQKKSEEENGSPAYDVIGGEFCFCYFYAKECLA